ncbi:MAG TPA: hypothetical protein VM914_00430 [Pyrinomonadaceae bacterium]|jgi:hypothetical protein|nr:hypothetical protein [Pyrinomonadaceae bacterium]
MLTSSSFSFREMLQLILPTLIALCLFAPFFESEGHRFDATTLVFGGIVLSYLVSGLVGWVAGHVVKVMLLLNGIKRYEKLAERVEGKWRIETLEASMLTKEEQEYLDLIGSYVLLTRVICFYLSAYCLVNVWLLVGALASQPPAAAVAADAAGGLSRFWAASKSTQTPVFGGWKVYTAYVLPASALSIIFLLRDYLEKYEQLYLPGGLYDEKAEKYQKSTGGLALAVWGSVTTRTSEDGKESVLPVPCLDVKLKEGSRTVAGPLATDKDGYFQFEEAFADCKGKDCALELDASCVLEAGEAGATTKGTYLVTVPSPASLSFNLTDTTVPFFPITVVLTPAPVSPKKESESGNVGGDRGAGATTAAPRDLKKKAKNKKRSGPKARKLVRLRHR